MVKSICGLALVLVSSAASCGWYLQARSVLTPAPSFDCVTSTLSNSPDIIQMDKPQHSHGNEGVDVELRDSSSEHLWAVFVRSSHQVPSDTLIFATTWSGRKRPSDAEVQAVAGLAGRILDQIRMHCAPEASKQIACTFNGKTIPCGPSA